MSTTMGVIQLGPYPPPQGGIQTHLVGLRKLLLERGIPCAVVNLTRFRKDEADDIYYPKHALEVARLLVRLRHPVLHLHIGGRVTGRLLGLSLFCCLLPRRRTVLTFHSGGYPTSAAGLTAGSRTLRGFVFQRFHRIIAVNTAIVDLFRKFGVRPDRLRLIPPFAESVPPLARPLADHLRDFFALHRPLLLTVGLLEPEYDLGLQIEVLGAVRERFPKAGLVILGAGGLEAPLRAAIAARPYAEHVLLYGDCPHPMTLRAIADSDVLLRTTRYDGDSISVREALALGTPVIATDNGMRPEGVDLIPPADGVALLDAITRRLTEGPPPHRQPVGADKNLSAVGDVYDELWAELGAIHRR